MADIADLDQHKSVEQLNKELLVLKRENHAAMQTITKLLRDLSKKSEELDHLRSLVTQTVPVVVNKKNEVAVPAKDDIALSQLERLRKISNERILTLEEARMFDILVKAQQAPKETKGHANYRDISDIELVKIAEKKDE